VPLEPEHAPAAPDDLADERALLAAGMSVLSARERRILELRYFEDRSQADIAREVGLSQAHVSRLIRRALERLRAAVVADEAEAYPRDQMAIREVEERAPQQATHSGRLLVRMPQSLHAEVAQAAERDQVSINNYINSLLAAGTQWRRPMFATLDEDLTDKTPGPDALRRMLRVAVAANIATTVFLAAVAVVLLLAA
jgi:DNA-binding CsgD family transcriptional regulator